MGMCSIRLIRIMKDAQLEEEDNTEDLELCRQTKKYLV
jgi:hypothetical protein